MPPSCADQQHPAAVGRDGRTAEDYKSVYRRRHRAAAVSAKQYASGGRVDVDEETLRLDTNLNIVAVVGPDVDLAPGNFLSWVGNFAS